MANLSLTQVNLKIQFARKQLSFLVGMSDVLGRQSCLEAALFHLNNAYQHYLRELAEAYNLKNFASIATLNDLVAAFQAANKAHAEADEISLLLSNKDSWLVSLITAYDDVWKLPPASSRSYEDYAKEAESQLIQVVIESTPIKVNLDEQSLQAWIAAFVGLIQRHRDTSAEF